MTKRRQSSNPRTIDPREWDFRSCPKNELPFCFVYENARELEHLWFSTGDHNPETVESWRASNQWPDSVPDYTISGIPGTPSRSFLQYFPEFPEKPWLAITPDQRAVRLEKCPIFDPPVESVISGSDSVEAVSSIQNEKEERWLTRTYAFRVNWSYGDEKLADAFNMWLKSNRPKSSFRNSPHAPTTYEDMMKKLGALRLLRLLGWSSAVELTKHVLGYSLYSDSSQTPWKRAANEAARFMNIGHERERLYMKVVNHFDLSGARDNGLLTSEEIIAMFGFLLTAKPKTLRPMLKWSQEQFLDEARRLARERLNI